MALRCIKGCYYAYFRDVDGRLKTRTLKTKDPVDAIRLHEEYMEFVLKRKQTHVIVKDFPEFFPQAHLAVTPLPKTVLPIPKDGEHSRNGLPLSSMIEELEKIQPLPITSRRIIARFLKSMTVKYMDMVTPEMAQNYLEQNFSHGRNYKSYNNNKGVLNKAFKLLLVKAKLTRSPFESIVSRKIKNVFSHRPITATEFKRIYRAANLPTRVAAALGFFAGMDISTAFSIPCNAIYLKERLIRWKRPKSGQWFTCGIQPELLQILTELNFPADSEKPLLSHLNSKTAHSAGVDYKKLFEKLKIKDTEEGKASFHSFRASFFTRCDAGNLHRRTISLAGGHKSDAMNDLYSHDVSAAHEVEKLPKIGLFS